MTREDPVSLLVPRPQVARPVSESFELPPHGFLGVHSEETFTPSWFGVFREFDLDLGRACSDEAKIFLLRTESDPGSTEAYRLLVGRGRIQIEAPSDAGLFYGLTTLAQWFRIHGARPGAEIPGLEVEDRPDFPHRGVMLDISRNKVPRLETLIDLVDLLAGFKINQLQLYTEHTFAYRGHGEVWQGASPLTPRDIERLQSHCQQRFVDLVPNQNSFGHFHRWLRHDTYRPLAECPEGIDHPFSEAREPFSLCPIDPGSLRLLEDLFDQLLPHFDSPFFNVGLDETMDLGQGRSEAICQERGKERVYLDFLHKVHELAAQQDRRMMFWGDIILNRPELISSLPKDAIALEWGYEADHPFAEDCQKFAEAGLDFYVCPGTGSWHSFAGRTDNALANLASAAENGHRAGSLGYLITDWGDNGHLQTLPVSYLPFLAGANFAWNVGTAQQVSQQPVHHWLDLHVFRDTAAILGQVSRDLGNAYQHTGAPPKGAKAINGSSLFFVLAFALRPSSDRRGQGMTRDHLGRTREFLQDAVRDLSHATPSSPRANLLKREFAWTHDILRAACDLAELRLQVGEDVPLGDLPESDRRPIGLRLEDLSLQRHDLWLARHRPGGMRDSLHRLERVADGLLGR